MHYTVRKNKTTRITYRLAAGIIIVVPACEIWAFIMGYGRDKKLLFIICILLILYGLYLFLHTFRKTMYDITYNFEEEGLRIRHVRGETVYPYDKIDDVSLITPEDPNQYNIISIRTGKETFVIPFTLKKAQCDTVYEFLMSYVTAAKIADDNSQQ